jgi:hypothetical protein
MMMMVVVIMVMMLLLLLMMMICWCAYVCVRACRAFVSQAAFPLDDIKKLAVGQSIVRVVGLADGCAC